MEKLTGSTCRSLMEAYDAVYNDNTRSKLEEEQNNVEFNEFIEILISEGYDLSEYTCDDLYEYYINEGIGGAIIKGLLKAGKGALKTAWRGTTLFDPKTQTSKFTPGAKQSTKGMISALGRAAPWLGLAAGADQYFTGGGGRSNIGKGIQALRTSGHNLPSPEEVQGSIQDTQKNIQNNPLLQDPRKQQKGGVPSVPSWLGTPQKEELESLDNNYINESPNWNSAPKGKDWGTLTLGKETKIYVPGLGWQFPATARNYFRGKGDPNWYKIPNPPQPEKPTPPRSAQPPAPSGTPSAQPPAPSGTPSAQPPAPSGTPPATPTPRPAPATPARPAPTPPAPTLSPMDAWKKANEKLAAASAERERIRGTSQTDNPLMKDMRSRLPAPTSPQAPDFQKTMTSGKYKDQGFQRLTQNIKSSYEYDAFDLVLEYLLSQGHVESLDEALYVMMEMNAECIQSIVEGDPSFQIKRSTGAGALTPNAAAQLGSKAVELQRKKASEVDLPDLKQSPSSMIRGV